MSGTVGRYRKPSGDEEVRIHFPEWTLPDGRIVMNVTVFPHLCGTCAGGNHTHVEMNDIREVVEVLARDTVMFSEEEHAAISRLLVEKIAVDALTKSLAEHVSSFT